MAILQAATKALLMPTVDERLKHVTLKVKRAKEHLGDLDLQIRGFLAAKPYKVATKRDPQTRKLIYYVSAVQPTPECLALVSGDAIQNLVSALDHLAYQLVLSDTSDNPPNPNWIYFPIADDAAKYEAKKRRKMDGAWQETFDVIDALKPYKGGNDLLWMLHRLNNIEKHRLLITVGSIFQSLNLGAHTSAMMAEFISTLPNSPFHGIDLTPFNNVFFQPPGFLFPLKVSDELFTDGVDAKVNEKLQFRFNVALSEPPIIEAHSLLETIRQFTVLVEDIVTVLTPRLR